MQIQILVLRLFRVYQKNSQEQIPADMNILPHYFVTRTNDIKKIILLTHVPSKYPRKDL